MSGNVDKSLVPLSGPDTEATRAMSESPIFLRIGREAADGVADTALRKWLIAGAVLNAKFEVERIRKRERIRGRRTSVRPRSRRGPAPAS